MHHSRLHSARRGTRGSSLLEVLIAIAISITALGAATRSQLEAERLAAQSRQTLAAVSMLNAAVARVEQVGALDLWNGAAGLADGQAVPGIDLGSLGEPSLVLNLPQKSIFAAAPAVVEFELVLAWSGPRGSPRRLSQWGAVR